METWIEKKTPKKEKIQVQYMNQGNLVAILTRDLYTRDFKLYDINFEEKKLLLLGKSQTPSKLENKYLSIIEQPYGYALKKDSK